MIYVTLKSMLQFFLNINTIQQNTHRKSIICTTNVVPSLKLHVKMSAKWKKWTEHTNVTVVDCCYACKRPFQMISLFKFYSETCFTLYFIAVISIISVFLLPFQFTCIEFTKLIDFSISICMCMFLGFSVCRMFVKYVHQIMKHFGAIDWPLEGSTSHEIPFINNIWSK